MPILELKNLKKTYGNKLIFENVSFEVNEKDKIAIVGRNGTGKTTIFKIINGLEYADSGENFVKKGIKIGYLEQEPNYESLMAIDVIKSAKKELLKLSKDIDENYQEMATISDENLLMKLSEKNDRLTQQYASLGGYEFESDVAKVVNGLNIDKSLLYRPFNTLSGGEKTTIILAKILLDNPDILLLDEPTNHLDIESMEWLEKYLNRYSGAVLLVSHDRYFLDNVAHKIFELDVDGIEEYNGNYTRYTVEKELRYLSRLKSYNSQQYRINRMENQIKKFRALNTPGLNKKANEIEHRLEKMDKLPKPVLEKRKISIDSAEAKRSGNDVLVIENLSKTVDGKTLFKNANLLMKYKDRIGILGKNGCGKTTLLKTILGELHPDSGSIKIGTKLNIGYLNQVTVFPDGNVSILDYYCNTLGVSSAEARNKLAKILFTGSDVVKKVGQLSGGEKKRLQLSVILAKNPNLLILDEPTNHLDLASREILEETLSDFEGNMIIVSHDRYFLNKLADKLWVFNDQKITEIDGNYEYFRQNKDRLLNSPKYPLQDQSNKRGLYVK